MTAEARRSSGTLTRGQVEDASPWWWPGIETAWGPRGVGRAGVHFALATACIKLLLPYYHDMGPTHVHPVKTEVYDVIDLCFN